MEWWKVIGKTHGQTARQAARAARFAYRLGLYIEPRAALELVWRVHGRVLAVRHG